MGLSHFVFSGSSVVFLLVVLRLGAPSLGTTTRTCLLVFAIRLVSTPMNLLAITTAVEGLVATLALESGGNWAFGISTGFIHFDHPPSLFSWN